jgi:hypothetical protein
LGFEDRRRGILVDAMAGGDSLGDESEEGGCVLVAAMGGLAQARRSEEDWQVREDTDFLRIEGVGERPPRFEESGAR